MISGEAIWTTMASALLVSGCAKEHPIKQLCDFFGGVDVIDAGEWELARSEIANKLATQMAAPSGTKPFQTINYIITPLEEWDYQDLGVNEHRKSFLVSKRIGDGRKVAVMHGVVRESVPPLTTRGAGAQKRYMSCFSVKNWVQEL